MKNTQIRANSQLTNRLKQLADVRGQKESMATLISTWAEAEAAKYMYTQDGYAKAGDQIQLANEDRELTDELKTIKAICVNDVVLSDMSVINRTGPIAFFSKINKRG